METSNDFKKLEELLLQTRSIYSEISTDPKLSLEKRIGYYNQGNKCIEQAKSLIPKLQQEINSLDLNGVTNADDQKKIDCIIELLENPKITLVESIKLYTELKKIRAGSVTDTKVFPNIKEDDVRFEEVNDFLM